MPRGGGHRARGAPREPLLPGAKTDLTSSLRDSARTAARPQATALSVLAFLFLFPPVDSHGSTTCYEVLLVRSSLKAFTLNITCF